MIYPGNFQPVSTREWVEPLEQDKMRHNRARISISFRGTGGYATAAASMFLSQVVMSTEFQMDRHWYRWVSLRVEGARAPLTKMPFGRNSLSSIQRPGHYLTFATSHEIWVATEAIEESFWVDSSPESSRAYSTSSPRGRSGSSVAHLVGLGIGAGSATTSSSGQKRKRDERLDGGSRLKRSKSDGSHASATNVHNEDQLDAIGAPGV